MLRYSTTAVCECCGKEFVIKYYKHKCPECISKQRIKQATKPTYLLKRSEDSFVDIDTIRKALESIEFIKTSFPSAKGPLFIDVPLCDIEKRLESRLADLLVETDGCGKIEFDDGGFVFRTLYDFFIDSSAESKAKSECYDGYCAHLRFKSTPIWKITDEMADDESLRRFEDLFEKHTEELSSEHLGRIKDFKPSANLLGQMIKHFQQGGAKDTYGFKRLVESNLKNLIIKEYINQFNLSNNETSK